MGASDGVSVWQGAVTVNAGGTLKTTGRVRIVGTTTVQAGASGVANGKLDVESGELFPTLGSQTMSGDLYIRAGATFHANVSDGVRYADQAPRIYVWGTFDCGTVRQTIGVADRVYFYDGSSATGVGDGNGGFDSYQDNCRFIFQGKVAFDTPFRSRTAGQTVQFAFCEGAEVVFTRGFGNGAGACEFVAATQGEGNTTGTLNQLTTTIVDLGSSTSLIKPVGTVTFVPTGASQLKLEINQPTAMTVVADSAKLLQARAFLQTLPLMTGTGAVRLTGDALVSIPAGSTTVFTFDGPNLCLPQGAPLALSAGTTFLRPLTIIANDLPTGSTMLLTGAGAAALDPATVTVKPGHRGIPLAPSFAAAKVEDEIVVNGVTAYATDGWIEPFLTVRALIWLDASDVDNFDFKTGTFDKVARWKDKSISARHADAYTVPSHSANWGTYGIAAGVPAFLMGEIDSGIDLLYTRMTTIRTAFFAMSIRNGGGCKAFWLGDNSVYDFHRGAAGQYSYTGGANPNNTWYCDGVKIADTKNTVVPTDRHVYSCTTRANLNSDRLTCDRNCDTYGRHGGRELSELICLDEELGDADRQAIEAYLAAKWMGANPTAGRTSIDYHIDETLTVAGSHEGTVPLTFSDGSEIVADQPSATAPMLKTTGPVTVDGTVKVTINATRLGPGTYTVIEGGAGSNISSLDAFTANIQSGANLTANLAVEDGKLVLKVVEAASSTLLWRPSGTDLTWSTDIVNWLDGETATAFMPGKNVRFDGQDTAQGPIVVNDQFTVGTWTMEGAKDYTFTGTGTLEGLGATTLGGTGTVTLNGPNLGDQNLVIGAGRKVVLGADAGPDALGTTTSAGGGTVKIEAGGQFNLNFTSTANADMRNEITHKKDFLIAGDGPDGRGAIVSDSLDGRSLHTTWNCVFRRVELTDDATVSGTDRFDVRALPGTSSTSTGGVFGPDKRLTVKATGIFGIISLPIDLGAITVTDGGIFRPESPTSVSIPGGVTLDNGILHGYSTTFPATVPFDVTAAGGTIDVESGTTTINGPLTIPENATLTLTGASTSYTGVYNGAVTNNGMISVVNGVHKFAGPAVGDFNISVTGGNFYFAKGFTGEHINLTTASVGVYVADGVKFDTMDVSNGFFSFRTDSLAGPEFNAVNLTSESTSFDVLPQANGIADVKGPVYVNKTGGTMFVYGPNNTAEHGMALELHGSVSTAWVGLTSNRAGTLEIKTGSDIAFGDLRLGQGNAAGPSAGRVIIDSGAKVVANSLWVGEWSGNPNSAQTHKLNVGGELNVLSNQIYVAFDSPRTEMTIFGDGVVRTKGLQIRNNNAYGNGTGAGDGHHVFRQEGGLLEMGPTGFQCESRPIPGVSCFDLQNGVVSNTAAYGISCGTRMFFGYDKLGGHVEYDLGEFLVNWHTAIAGASDVTIKGAANFQGDRYEDRAQGAMLGKVTVENTGLNDLKPISVFGGGLKLADGVSVQVANYGDEKYLYSIVSSSVDAANGSTWGLDYTSANFFPFFHKNLGDESGNPKKPFPNESGMMARGEFYVPADKAGVWSFLGCYDDYVSIYVDGAKVFSVTTKCATGTGSTTLTEGWHTFSIYAADSGGRSGAGLNDQTMTLCFHVGETTSTSAADYLKFAPGIPFGDGTNLQIRPYANACIWSYQNGNGNWDTTESWAHVKAMKSVGYMHKCSTASDASSYSQWFAGKANKFEGWMKVEDGKEGEWTFKMAYDDNKRLRIDGVDVINHVGDWSNVYSGKRTLTPGWHRWEVRVQDGSGGWGPQNNVNGGNTLSYIAPGEQEKQFNETNLKLAATLGDISVLERTGIYRELDLGKNATLVSLGTVTMPIFGTLKGKGTLEGPFAFEGPVSTWEVEGTAARSILTSCAVFSSATPETYKGLARVKALFDKRPLNAAYVLANAPAGLTSADLAAVATAVTDAEGNDYSDAFSVRVKDGKVVLANARPSGMTIFVR